MATTLITQTARFYLTSGIPQDLRWATDQQAIWVQIYAGPWSPETVMMIKTQLVPVEGFVTLYEIRELLERYMLSFKESRLFPVHVQHSENGTNWTEAATWTVVYCEKNINLQGMSPSVWLERNFLSTLTAKVLPTNDDVMEQLFFVQPANAPATPLLHVTYIDDEDVVQATDITLQANYPASDANLYCVQFSVAAVKAAVAAAVDVIAVTLSVGNRHMEYYRPSRRENVGFVFRNAFNVMESAYLSAVITRKTEDGRKLANVSGTLAHYDRKPVTEYEVQTSPLSFEEASWIDQLITSPEVTLLDGTPLIITDGNAECHNDNSELNAAKFSYKELDQRHTIIAAAPVANIFTVPPHSYQFK